MAYVGLKYCVFAPIASEVRFQPIEYSAGMVIGRMIGANINITRNSDGLYADDGLAESDNSITGGTVSINLDDLLEDAAEMVTGLKKTGDEGDYTYHETGEPSPYGGLGYLRVRRINGKTKYVAYWCHKVQLAVASESASTKGSTITWQTPTLDGNLMGVENTADGEKHYRERKVYDTEGDAIKYINDKAKILAA